VLTGKVYAKSCHCLYHESTITLLPSHTCCRWSSASVAPFTICRQYCEQQQSWEVSKQRCQSSPRGENSRHRKGGTRRAYKAGRDGCRSHQSQGNSFQLLSASLESCFFPRTKDVLGEGAKCS